MRRTGSGWMTGDPEVRDSDPEGCAVSGKSSPRSFALLVCGYAFLRNSAPSGGSVSRSE
jgi:hypothetical protein